MKKILVFAAAMAALSSCSKNEVALNTSDTNAITFNTYTGVSTKGAILYQDDLEADGFGVLAYDQGSEGEFSDASIPNFMYNTMVSKGESSGWSYSPTKYWSNDSYNTYSFFGYAPYTATPTTGDIVLSLNDDEGAPTATVTIADDAEDMIDFVAGQVVDITKYGSAATGDSAADVTMYFKHQLTRVSFSAKADTNDDAGVASTYVNITSIRILGSAPTSPIAIKTNGADVEVGDSYSTYCASNALYKVGTYTFATTTTDTDKTVHGQDGTWVAGDQIEDAYDTESILAVVTPNDEGQAFAETDYATEGVLVQCSDEAQEAGTPLFADGEYLFLIPPVTTNDNDDYVTGISDAEGYETKIMVEIIYDIVTLDSGLAAGYAPCSTNNLAIAAIPTDALVQGFAYDFLITITGSSIIDPTDPDFDPTDPDDDQEEEAFDTVVITGTLLEWDETELDTYPLTL